MYYNGFFLNHLHVPTSLYRKIFSFFHIYSGSNMFVKLLKNPKPTFFLSSLFVLSLITVGILYHVMRNETFNCECKKKKKGSPKIFVAIPMNGGGNSCGGSQVPQIPIVGNTPMSLPPPYALPPPPLAS